MTAIVAVENRVAQKRAARIAWSRLDNSDKRLAALKQLVVKSPELFKKAGVSEDVLKEVSNFDELPELVAAKLGRYASLEGSAAPFFGF